MAWKLCRACARLEARDPRPLVCRCKRVPHAEPGEWERLKEIGARIAAASVERERARKENQ